MQPAMSHVRGLQRFGSNLPSHDRYISCVSRDKAARTLLLPMWPPDRAPAGQEEQPYLRSTARRPLSPNRRAVVLVAVATVHGQEALLSHALCQYHPHTRVCLEESPDSTSFAPTDCTDQLTDSPAWAKAGCGGPNRDSGMPADVWAASTWCSPYHPEDTQWERMSKQQSSAWHTTVHSHSAWIGDGLFKGILHANIHSGGGGASALSRPNPGRTPPEPGPSTGPQKDCGNNAGEPNFSPQVCASQCCRWGKQAVTW